MSVPISATITSAARRWTPGIVLSSSTAGAKGAILLLDPLPERFDVVLEILDVGESMRSSRNAWWPEKRASSALRSAGSFFLRSLPLASSESAWGSCSPEISAHHLPAGDAHDVARHASKFDACILEYLMCRRLTARVRSSISALR